LLIFQTAAIVLGAIIIFAIAFWARYKTVGADEAMIVTGNILGKKN
jgi:flotillin